MAVVVASTASFHPPFPEAATSVGMEVVRAPNLGPIWGSQLKMIKLGCHLTDHASEAGLESVSRAPPPVAPVRAQLAAARLL